MRVTIEHVRSIPGYGPEPGFCASGARDWFARHGLDWSDFVRHGIDAAVLEATGDHLALTMVAHAKAVAQEGSHGR